MSEQKVVLVDRKDKSIGTMGKMEAHITGRLHRAFSVFIFNSKGELMIQQRALSKYHSPGLWTNTCCSHPKWEEDIKLNAIQRLKEEMGIECSLISAFTFVYKSEVGQGLIEHEFDHVFIGTYDEAPLINRIEVCDWKFINIELLKYEIDNQPDNYTEWFRIAFNKVENYLKENSL